MGAGGDAFASGLIHRIDPAGIQTLAGSNQEDRSSRIKPVESNHPYRYCKVTSALCDGNKKGRSRASFFCPYRV